MWNNTNYTQQTEINLSLCWTSRSRRQQKVSIKTNSARIATTGEWKTTNCNRKNVMRKIRVNRSRKLKKRNCSIARAGRTNKNATVTFCSSVKTEVYRCTISRILDSSHVLAHQHKPTHMWIFSTYMYMPAQRWWWWWWWSFSYSGSLAIERREFQKRIRVMVFCFCFSSVAARSGHCCCCCCCAERERLPLFGIHACFPFVCVFFDFVS